MLSTRVAALERLAIDRDASSVPTQPLQARVAEIDAKVSEYLDSRASRDLLRLFSSIRLPGAPLQDEDPLPQSAKALLLVEAQPRLLGMQAQLVKVTELAEEILDWPFALSEKDAARLDALSNQVEDLSKALSQMHAEVMALVRAYAETVAANADALVEWEQAKQRT